MTDTRLCLQVASLLEHWLCLLLAGPGILNQGCSEGMELVLLFPFPHLRGGGKLKSPGKAVFLGSGGKSAVQKASQQTSAQVGRAPHSDHRLRRNPFWICALALLFGETHSLFLPYSLAPESPGLGSKQALSGAPRLLTNCLGLCHAWKAGPVGHTTSPSPGSPYDLMDRIMSTSFNFIKYFLTGSSKPSPIYISSYSSPAREQNRRLQVNLQYHFYRRPISRDQHSKGSAPVDLPELGPRRGRGAVPGDLCSLEAHPWFNRITSAVASCPCISELVTPCH